MFGAPRTQDVPFANFADDRVPPGPPRGQPNPWEQEPPGPPTPPGPQAPPGPPPVPRERADAWREHAVGLQRLVSLPQEPPRGFPRGVDLDTNSRVLEFMREQLLDSPFDEEEKDDRVQLWEKVPLDQDLAPPWVTLMPPEDLVIYKEAIEAVGCDFRSQKDFVSLVRSGNLGYLEGCRILAHLVKDSEEGFRHGPSQWLSRACEEAKEAIRNPAEWDGPKGKGKGKGSSSSSGDGAKGKGKGKGRGLR